MDPCASPLTGDKSSLETPIDPAYLGMVLDGAQQAAGLAGLGPNAAGRARLIAEEIFLHITGQCSLAGRRDKCRMEMELTPDGLVLTFHTRFLAYDPGSQPEYSLEEVLDQGTAQGLGLHLVKAYAKEITLTQRGPDRALSLLIPRREEDYGSRAWSRLTPSLRPGLVLEPMEHQGRRLHRLEDPASGKTYKAGELAHVVLSLIDGQKTFSHIMGRALKMFPEKTRHQVEDLFEVLIEKGLVNLTKLERESARVAVRKETQIQTSQALNVYGRVSGQELYRKSEPLIPSAAPKNESEDS